MNERDVQQIVETDHRLDQANELSGLELAKHRWHWTMDDSNPQRFESIREYASAVAKTHVAIQRHVNAYQIYLDKSVYQVNNFINTDHPVRFGDCYELARLSVADQLVIGAIAETRNIGLSTARQHHPEEVKQVKRAMDEYVEEHPESTPDERQEEARRQATFQVGLEKARERLKNPTTKLPKALVSVVILADLRDALVKVRDAGHEAARLDLDDADERDMAASIEKALAAILDAIEKVKRAMKGEEPVDWDAGLANLGKDEF